MRLTIPVANDEPGCIASYIKLRSLYAIIVALNGNNCDCTRYAALIWCMFVIRQELINNNIMLLPNLLLTESTLTVSPLAVGVNSLNAIWFKESFI